jgi:hypothetical protein
LSSSINIFSVTKNTFTLQLRHYKYSVSTIFKYQLELLLIVKFPNLKENSKKTKGLVYLNDNFQQKQIHLSESINIGQFTQYLIIA